MVDTIKVEKKVYDRNFRGTKLAITRAKKFIRRIKSMSRCIKCGESRPWCLDFHHRVKEEKFMSIPDMAKRGFPIEVIKAELNKCDCLCSNDHREHHFRQYWLKI